jgi:hypothetical protein
VSLAARRLLGHARTAVFSRDAEPRRQSGDAVHEEGQPSARPGRLRQDGLDARVSLLEIDGPDSLAESVVIRAPHVDLRQPSVKARRAPQLLGHSDAAQSHISLLP